MIGIKFNYLVIVLLNHKRDNDDNVSNKNVYQSQYKQLHIVECVTGTNCKVKWEEILRGFYRDRLSKRYNLYQCYQTYGSFCYSTICEIISQIFIKNFFFYKQIEYLSKNIFKSLQWRVWRFFFYILVDGVW